jgi:hypothetical protein
MADSDVDIVGLSQDSDDVVDITKVRYINLKQGSLTF